MHDDEADPDDRRQCSFSSLEAAQLALSTAELPSMTPAVRRARDVATTLWCRELSFPRVRTIAAAARTSPSTVVRSGKAVDLQAVVIRDEWLELVGGWFERPACDRERWIVEHAACLVDHDRSWLRLPGLVASAVCSSGAPFPVVVADLAPLHALAAIADVCDPWTNRRGVAEQIDATVGNLLRMRPTDPAGGVGRGRTGHPTVVSGAPR